MREQTAKDTKNARRSKKGKAIAMLEGKSMPSNMAAHTNHAGAHSCYFVEKSKYYKLSPLNAFPLKFRK